jgi:hypothetical protein
MKSFSLQRNCARLLGALVALFFAAQLNSAFAVTVSPGTVLPSAISYEYFGLNFANNIQTRDTVGTLNYSGGPGCGGNCIATTQLGSSPSVSAKVNEVVFQATSGGGVQARLGYFVAYLNSPGSYNVNLHATETLSSPDGSAESAYLGFGPAYTSTPTFNDFNSKTFEEAACLNRCPAPGFAIPTSPFVADHLVSMEANTLYFVELDVLLDAQPTNAESSASIDPTFTTSASGGQFVFSPGVVAATPLPAALPLFTSALGALGLFGWRAKRKDASFNPAS